jgi:hypothetical protein
MSEPFLRWMVLHYCPTACRDYIQVANLAAEKARLDEPSLGFDNLTTLPNCLLGVHDGPKVAMPGDRLVNGAGVSPRRRGRSTISDLVAGTDGRSESTSWRPFVGH